MNLQGYKDILIQRLTEEELSVYDDDPFWDKDKELVLMQARAYIKRFFPKLPEAFQLEFLYWAKTNKMLGEYRIHGISILESYVYSGRLTLTFWGAFAFFLRRTLRFGLDEEYLKRQLEPCFHQKVPGRQRIISPQELEYIIHSRQLEYGFRDDPLPDVDPIQYTFDLAKEKEIRLRSDLIRAGKDDGYPISEVTKSREHPIYLSIDDVPSYMRFE